jgi:DNA-binding SARP family transcriptional activator
MTHPWWIPLEGGWFQLDPAWRPALAAGQGTPPVAAVARVVGDLVGVSAPEEALELCLDAACPGLASDLLAELAPDLVAADRDGALRRWLGRLPPQERARHAPLLARFGVPDAASAVAAPREFVRHRRWWPERRVAHRKVPSRREPRTSTATPLPPWPGVTQSAAPLSVSVRLLGAVEVRLNGRTVEHWQGRVGRTALAYVLLQRRRVPPDELAGALWPDVPAETARNRLHVALHRLRADLVAVDPRPVLVHEQGYAVHPEVEVHLDTDRFERLANAADEALRRHEPVAALTACLGAVDCYGGDLLAGERDDEWALLAREHYRVRLLDVLGKAAHLASDLDRPALAVDLGQRLLALDFCREDLHRLLMRAYARLGQPQLALRQYQTCVRQLRLEFGLDAAPETVELFDQIRCQQPV